MRVIDPKQFRHGSKPKKSRKAYWVVGVLIVFCLVGGIVYSRSKKATVAQKKASDETVSDTKAQPQPAANNGPIKQFTGQEFKDLYYGIAYPNTQQITEPIPITGNIEADQRIRKLAEARGYKQTVLPQNAIVKINEPRLEGDDLLQPLAADGWQSLKSQAKTDGIPLSIISAYRSPEWQRNLFLGRLYASGISATQIANGTADNAVNQALSTAAVPGYSRHHTGYTMDLWCEDGSGAFVNSSCYRWISKNNYQKAKENGWIPSYPEGTDLQGPEPEPWEYVWVGTNNLR